uniref:Uncharacterized protein n=1 Tax=Anopheles atroparvus TaxID=41427 RepID=A0AAG5DBG4_ANOAO
SRPVRCSIRYIFFLIDDCSTAPASASDRCCVVCKQPKLISVFRFSAFQDLTSVLKIDRRRNVTRSTGERDGS